MQGPEFQVEIDQTTSVEWSEMVDLFEDANIYQTWSYGAVRWGEKNLSHLVLRRNGDVVGMAQIRIIRPTRLNVGMAYLRWGPLCHRRGTQINAEVVSQLSHALRKEYVRKRGLLLQVLPNAFVESERAVMIESTFSDFTQGGGITANTYRTFVLDLAPPLDELRKKLDGKWRNQLVRAEKNDLRIVSGNGTNEYKTFHQMYREMEGRKGFESTVDIDEFEKIQMRLPVNHRLRILICEQNEVPVAGLVASIIGDSAIYLLGATSDAGLKAKGAYLLQWTLIREIKEQNIKWYDLGGIDPDVNPGVYHFKKGLSGIDARHAPSMVACSNVVSSAVVRATQAAQRAMDKVKSFQMGRARAHLLRQRVSRIGLTSPASD